jgi:hypothetical protein
MRSLQPFKNEHEISLLFSIFVGHFCPPGSGSAFLKSVRIRIQNTGRKTVFRVSCRSLIRTHRFDAEDPAILK